MTRAAWMWCGLVLAAGLVGPQALSAAVIHLKSGGQLEVDAWRDGGDAVEFAHGGGIIRIPKAEIRSIDGQPTPGELKMYSAPRSEEAPTDAPVGGAAAEEMVDEMLSILGEAERLMDQASLEPDEKASAYRRLVARWRELDVPAPLLEPYQLGEKAILLALEAFDAADAGAEAREEIEGARKEITAAREAIKKATNEG